jgi:hypothetical protein
VVYKRKLIFDCTYLFRCEVHCNAGCLGDVRAADVDRKENFVCVDGHFMCLLMEISLKDNVNIGRLVNKMRLIRQVSSPKGTEGPRNLPTQYQM